MWKNLKWLRLTPDRPGRGGQKTGIHSFQQEPVNDVRVLSGAYVYQGAWRREFDPVSYPSPQLNDPGAVFPLALHGYVYPSLTNPAAAPTTTILSQHQRPGGIGVWDFSSPGGGLRQLRPPNQQAGVFQNINGRCFFGDGGTEALIMDDRTPAIHAQKNQNLGIGTPQQPLGLVDPALLGGYIDNVTNYGSVYAHNASVYLNTPNPNSPVGTVTALNWVIPFVINPNYPYDGGAPMAAGNPAGAAVTSNTTPFAAPGTLSITTGTSLVTFSNNLPAGFQYAGLALNFAGYSYVILTHGNNAGALNLDGTVTALTIKQAIIMGVYDGPTLTNIPYTVTGSQIQMGAASTLVMGNSAAGTLGYGQATASDLVQIAIHVETVFGSGIFLGMGNISFGTSPGPTYAYSWYDPETGHMSNISPLFQVPNSVPTNYQSVSTVFQIDSGHISYPTGVDATRFSHLMFFRTLSTPGSSTLYPIGSLNPFVGKVHPGSASTRGSWNPGLLNGWMGLPNDYTDAPPTGAVSNFFYDFSSDSDLLLSGGFRAPQFTNEKPMLLLRGGATQPAYPYALAYWDRRTWIASTQDPDVIQFSCDEAQCPLGIPEESFPPTNFLRIPAADGRVMALKTVGDMLLVTTERWAYIVAGNNESNYRLMKVSASMPGVGYYQMDEFPTLTGAEGEPSTLFYLGRDRKIYQWTLGSRVIPISQPIQDQIDNFLTTFPRLQFYIGSRVHCVSSSGRRAVVFSPYLNNAVGTGIPTFIYDIDNGTWSNYTRTGGVAGELYGGTAPMTTVLGSSVNPVNEMYSIYSNSLNTVICGSWLDDTVATATSGITIQTFPMNFDGRKTRKRLVGINIHATAGTWTGAVSVNEGPAFSFTFGPYPDPLTSIYGTGASPVDGATVQDIVALTGQFVPVLPTFPVIGYRFVVSVFKGAPDTNPAKLYAIDIAYQDEQEAGDGDP